MKPSEIIEKYTQEILKNHYPSTSSTPYADIAAIVQYLDEEYENEQNAIEKLKRDIVPM